MPTTTAITSGWGSRWSRTRRTTLGGTDRHKQLRHGIKADGTPDPRVVPARPLGMRAEAAGKLGRAKPLSVSEMMRGTSWGIRPEDRAKLSPEKLDAMKQKWLLKAEAEWHAQEEAGCGADRQARAERDTSVREAQRKRQALEEEERRYANTLARAREGKKAAAEKAGLRSPTLRSTTSRAGSALRRTKPTKSERWTPTPRPGISTPTTALTT